MISSRLPRIWFGGDYCPDQWPEEIWREDMRLFTLAGVSVATLPVFSWAKLQTGETRYDFSWLDKAVDLLDSHGIKICMATSTAAVSETTRRVKAGCIQNGGDTSAIRSKLKKRSASALVRMPLRAKRSHWVKFSSQ